MAVATLPEVDTRPETETPRMWNVVLLNDDDHSVDYCWRMLQEIFRYDERKALKICKAVHEQGRAVCMTTHRELAELKQEQVHEYGADPMIAACKGSMSCVLEPAFADGDPDEEE